MAAARNALAPGVTELEVYGEIVAAMAKAGGENPGITMPVASGVKSACVHALASRRVIMPGNIVNVNVSGIYHRYHANMARCFSIGEPDPAVRAALPRAAGMAMYINTLAFTPESAHFLQSTPAQLFVID